MNILYLSAEVFPFRKVGGLGDVAGSLPKALKEIGADIRVVMPKYKDLGGDIKKIQCIPPNITVSTNPKYYFPNVCESTLPNSEVPIYFLDEPIFFERDCTYGYNDDLQRFCLFTKACLELCKRIHFQPDIIHMNDWQSAIIPLFLKCNYADDPFFKNTKTVLSIHNIHFQGIAPQDILNFAQIPCSAMQSLEDDLRDGDVDFLYEGIFNADAITTVSQTYAKEVLSPPLGEGMENILSKRADEGNFFGIVNGIDLDVWNPETDKLIDTQYSSKILEDKQKNKRALQKLLNLPQNNEVPLIGMVTRLTNQKGFDLIEAIRDQIYDKDLQLVVLGTGDAHIHRLLEEMSIKHPQKISFLSEYNEARAHTIYAASDFFLMPSRFEPCGLGQLIAMRYGSIPIVHKTGGLADTVQDYKKHKTGEGIVIDEYKHDLLNIALDQAIEDFKNQSRIEKIRKHIMQIDFSWKKSAEEYMKVYRAVTNN